MKLRIQGHSQKGAGDSRPPIKSPGLLEPPKWMIYRGLSAGIFSPGQTCGRASLSAPSFWRVCYTRVCNESKGKIKYNKSWSLEFCRKSYKTKYNKYLRFVIFCLVFHNKWAMQKFKMVQIQTEWLVGNKLVHKNNVWVSHGHKLSSGGTKIIFGGTEGVQLIPEVYLTIYQTADSCLFFGSEWRLGGGGEVSNRGRGIPYALLCHH